MSVIEKKKIHEIYKRAQLSDDFLFKKCMSDSLILTYFLRRIFGKENVGKIEFIHENHELNSVYEGHKVICDLFAIDDKGRSFVIENQNYRVKGFLNRLEYSCQISGVNLFNRDKYPNDDGSYSNFPIIYCVWICNKNPFGLNKGMMEFTKQADGVPNSLFDVQRQVVISRNCVSTIEDEFLQDFLRLMGKTTKENALLSKNHRVHLIYNRYEWYKGDQETEVEYMLSYEDQAYLRNQGEKMGFKKGMKQGREEVQVEAVLNLREKNCNISFIADALNLSNEKVEHIIEVHGKRSVKA